MAWTSITLALFACSKPPAESPLDGQPCAAPATLCGSSCVDTTTDPLHCGGCDNACTAPANATATCTSTGCGFACVQGFVDCDGMAANGCESEGDQCQACTVRQAEHPSYTTVARNGALCGGKYTPANVMAACGPRWHVCTLSEWQARYTAGTAPGGTVSSFGEDQNVRCMPGHYLGAAPLSHDAWDGDPSICDDPSYLPFNDRQVLFDNDGTTLLEGDVGCCGWQNTFAQTSHTEGLAVYCCLDE